MPQTSERKVIALQSDLMSNIPGLRHGVTRRSIGLGNADGNVGFGSPRDKIDAWRMRQIWCESIGIDPRTLVTAGQVHGNEIRVVHTDDAGRGATPESEHLGVADALITDAPNVALMTLHADCLMIFLVDPARPAVGVVHAGWRGTVVDIAGKAISAMTESYGTNPAEVRAFLGPAIAVCCNEVGPEVIAAWRDEAAILRRSLPSVLRLRSGWTPSKGSGQALGDDAESAVTRPTVKEHFDVPRANVLLLLRAGLRLSNIDVSPICTKCDGEEWFSHRGQGPLTGRHGAIISLA